MNPYIKKYIDQGIKVFACYPNKTPIPKNGFYGATLDPAELEKQFYDDSFLIGIPTGNTNGIVVVDIDVKDGRTVEELLEELKQYVQLPENLFQVQTPSGGMHLYFSVINTNLSSSVRFFDKNLATDLRGNGGYVCAPDGKNYIVYDDVDGLDIDDLKSRCPALPESVENYKKQSTEIVLSGTLPPEEIRELRSALNYIDADDRDTWIRVGMALKSTGSPSAEGLFNEYSQRSDKYNPKDQPKRWKTLKPKGDITIASIFHEAQKNGWVTTYEKKETRPILKLVTNTPHSSDVDEKANKKKEKPPAQIPISEEKIEELKELAKSRGKYYGKFTAIYPYRDSSGDLIYARVRYENGPEGKSGKVIPYYYSTYGDSEFGRWITGEPPIEFLPFYGSEELSKNSEKQILFVEGEKCKDIAQALNDHYIFLCIGNGVKGFRKHDFTLLDDREVAYWPNADKIGLKSAKIFKRIVPHSEVLDIKDKPEGWNVDNLIAEGGDINLFLEQCPFYDFESDIDIESGLPIIDITIEDLSAITPKAWAAIQAKNMPRRLFNYAGKAVRLVSVNFSASSHRDTLHI